MTVEITLFNNEEAIVLHNITHVSYSDDNVSEITFYHKDYKVTFKLYKIESMVIRK